MAHGWGKPKKQPAPRVVSAGSVSKPKTPSFNPKAQPAPKIVPFRP